MIFILLALLSRIKSLNISDIEVSGNQVIDTQSIKDSINQQMAGKYLLLFPKTNIFLYPENSIKNVLQDKFKRLENINLSVKNNKTLLVSLAERKALYTWCGAMPPDTTDVGRLDPGRPTSVATVSPEQCYFIDENGYIFDQAPYFSGNVYFKFYGSADLGSYFSKQNFQQLISFKNTLAGFGLKPVALYAKSNGDVEVFLSGGTFSTNGPQIIFKINEDYQNVAENLETALTTEPLQSQFKNKYASLLYIDLRFGNKVYYKFSTPTVAVK